MHFEIPAPHQTFDIPLEDGARIRMRRHGNPDGVRLLVTHGNGFAADAYYPVLAAPAGPVRPAAYSIFATMARTSRWCRRTTPTNSSAATSNAWCRSVRGELGREADRRHLPFDVGAHRDEARHRDRLALGRAACCSIRPNVPPTDHPVFPAMKAFEKQADRMGQGPPPPLRVRRRADAGIPAVARHAGLGRGRCTN